MDRNTKIGITAITLFTIIFGVVSLALILSLSPSIGSESFPSVEGRVRAMQDEVNLRSTGRRGSKRQWVIKNVQVDFEWNDKTYTASKAGSTFTYELFLQAKHSGVCRVYVNPENPWDSILSQGVSFKHLACLIGFPSATLLLFLILLRMIWGQDSKKRPKRLSP